jgi:CheY-like chemotaxis protein
MRILIADDDPDIVAALELVLRDMGHGTLSAGDGAAALRLLVDEQPDLLILDLRMPIKDGWEVLQEKLQDPKIRAIPTFILSGMTAEEFRHEELDVERARAGVLLMLGKPLKIDEIRRAIAVIVAERAPNP